MAKTVVINIKTDTSQSVNSLEELEVAINELKDALKKEQLGSAEFKRLSGELQNAQSEVKKLEKTFEGLEPEKKVEAFAKVGEGLAGGFAAATGAMALFGTESEQISRLAEKSQQAVAVALGLRAVAESVTQASIAKRIALEALNSTTTYAAAVALGVYNTVVGVSTGAMKLLRIAIATTGIGALVVGLGLLIANFDKVQKYVKGVIDKFEFLKATVEFLTAAWGALAEAIGIADTAEEKQLATAQKNSELSKVRQKQMQRDIDLLKARGATAEEIYKAEEELARTAYNDAVKVYNAKAKLGEQSAEDLENLKDLEKDYQIILLDRQKVLKDEADKEVQSQREKQAKLKDERTKYLSDLKKQLEDARIANIKDATEREIEQEKLNLSRKLESIKGQGQTENQLRLELEQTSNDKIQALKDKLAEENKAKETERIAKAIESQYRDSVAGQTLIIEAEKEKKQDQYDAQRDLATIEKNKTLENEALTNNERLLIEQRYAQQITEINTQQLETQKLLAEAKKTAIINSASSAAEGISRLSDAIVAAGNKQNAASKALAVASLAINTAVSIGNVIAGATAAAAAGGPAAPFLLIGYIASGLATVLTNFASAKKLLGGANAGSTAGAQGGSTSQGVQGNTITSTDNNPRTRIEQKTDTSIKAYVVETEMTDAQNKASKIKTLSQI